VIYFWQGDLKDTFFDTKATCETFELVTKMTLSERDDYTAVDFEGDHPWKIDNSFDNWGAADTNELT
jgi:hypothetical protein